MHQQGGAIMAERVYRLHLIKPSHYDDDGYVIQWRLSAIPSNSLAALHGIAAECGAQQALGPDVRLEIFASDETNTIISTDRIAESIKSADFGLVCLVGVQSNQFPRALDLARRLRGKGVQVAIGGFHVSGCVAMLPDLPPELKEAQALGVGLFAGEAAGRLDQVLRDAMAGALKPLYNYMNDLPPVDSAPAPLLPAEIITRTSGAVTSFDAGRGCPFQCSFCTIINVQGRKSRFRSADDVEAIIRRNYAQGIKSFFVTDDNFARNANWEAILDRIGDLRWKHGIWCVFFIQVDTLCHRIPGFIDKCARAGVKRVYIGLENINPANLVEIKKKQNRIGEYREMLLAWKRAGCLTYAGFIMGFAGDTPETILRDVRIIQRELPLDILEFFYLTPLPGSQDHQRLTRENVWMDPDLNKFDLEHPVTRHPLMSTAQWEQAYADAWDAYYSPKHIRTIMRRAAAMKISAGATLFLILWFYACLKLEKVHPLQGGYVRVKIRKDRRPGLPIENPLIFYPKYWGGLVAKHLRLAAIAAPLGLFRLSLKLNTRKALAYMDQALTPPTPDELGELEMFTASDSARAAAEKSRKRLEGQPASAA
jgi:radical SAM superfamily enzyme YgiQ (UPF0313 family)